jgi:hypothetical protein
MTINQSNHHTTHHSHPSIPAGIPTGISVKKLVGFKKTVVNAISRKSRRLSRKLSETISAAIPALKTNKNSSKVAALEEETSFLTKIINELKDATKDNSSLRLTEQMSQDTLVLYNMLYAVLHQNVEKIIYWTTNPVEASSFENVIADGLCILSEGIPIVSVVAQAADSAVGACRALYMKNKMALLSERLTHILRSPEARWQFIYKIFQDIDSNIYLNLCSLSTTFPQTTIDIMKGCKFIPPQHRWNRIIAEEVITIFMQAVFKKETWLRTEQELITLFTDAFNKVAQHYSDNMYQTEIANNLILKRSAGNAITQTKQTITTNLKKNIIDLKDTASTTIQKHWRRIQGKKEVNRRRWAIDIITRVIRTFLALRKKSYQCICSIRNIRNKQDSYKQDSYKQDSYKQDSSNNPPHHTKPLHKSSITESQKLKLPPLFKTKIVPVNN